MPADTTLAQRTDPVERALRLALWVFIVSMAFSILGSLLLQLVPAARRLFDPIYASLVKGPTWTYMALLPAIAVLMYVRSLGGALIAFFLLWGSFVGGFGELMGTSTGIPFGRYVYTPWLGPKILDHVPYFIPLSWFAMSIVSLDLAGRLVERRYERMAVAALFMILWDVSLDPAMNEAFPFWVYPDGGFFFGMPASNWVGWFAVSFVIMWGYEVIGGGLRSESPWAPLVFALNCLFPLSVSLVYGLWAAVLFGAVATALPLLVLRAHGRLGRVPSLRLR